MWGNRPPQAEMIGKYALHDRAQIRRRRKIATLIELIRLQSRPIGDHAAAFDRAAGEKRHRAGAVIGVRRTVHARCSAEFRHDNDRRVLPNRTKYALELVECPVQSAKQLRKTTRRAALIGMRVPSVECERGDARTVVGGDQACRALRCLFHTGGGGKPAARRLVHLACGNFFRREALCKHVGQEGIAMAVKIENAAREIFGRLGQRLRRPAEDRGSASHYQRCRWANAERAARGDPGAARQRRERAVEPTRTDAAWSGKAALEHILAVEMRTLAIGCGDGMHDCTLPGTIEPRKNRHGWVEREEGIERYRRTLPAER